MANKKDVLWEMLGLRFRAHPWHGIPLGEEAPAIVTAFIEIVPGDTIKYELDKYTGHLKVDRPQIYSNICPSLYGMIPQTYCGEKIGDYCSERTGRPGIVGDGDPLDICVLSEKIFNHGDFLLRAKPIGGLRMIDGGEADDKIIAVLIDDPAYGKWSDISECPESMVERLKHYFLTYKQKPGDKLESCEITHVYNCEEAHVIIKLANENYLDKFAGVKEILDLH